MSAILLFLKLRIRSFGYAFKGIRTLFASQANAQVHLFATALIIALGFMLNLSAAEWSLILICIALVLAAEGFNTALEFVVDLVSPEQHPLAGKAKDVAAGAVLLSVIVCGIIWGIIYLPKIWLIFFSV